MNRPAWKEFDLIQLIRRWAGKPGLREVLGIGDDAAAHWPERKKIELVTCDALIEGVHWDFRWCDPFPLGRKAAAVNLSDIAAMGGIPRRAYLVLALPVKTPVSRVTQLLKGLISGLTEQGVRLVGGDTVASPGPMMISLTIQGVVARNQMLCRTGARPGDLILVTGELGAAGAALAWLQKPRLGILGEKQVYERLVAPQPRLVEGRLLAASRKVSAMLDLSDGLAGDLRRLAQASQVGARIYAAHLPISIATRLVARRLGREALAFALTGGEDYELLFTCAPRYAAELIGLLRKKARTAAAMVGEILPARAGLSVVSPQGRKQPLPPGYEHGRTV